MLLPQFKRLIVIFRFSKSLLLLTLLAAENKASMIVFTVIIISSTFLFTLNKFLFEVVVRVK